MEKYPKIPNTSLIPKFSEKLIESENVLRYTLQLPFDKIETPDFKDCSSPESLSDLLEALGESIYNECSYLFNQNNPNVFGYKTSDVNDLSVLSTKNAFWKHLFKQDMILSSFDKLRKLIGGSISINSYFFTKLLNYTNDDSTPLNITLHGLDYLTGATDKKYLNIETDKNSIILREKLSSIHNIADLSPTASNIKLNLQNKFKILKGFALNSLILKLHNTEQYAINIKDCLLYLNMMEFFQLILTHRKEEIEKIPNFNISPIINIHKENKKFYPSNYNNYIQCVIYLLSQCQVTSLDKYITNNMKEPITEHNLSLSDKIYLRYQIEKIFAPIMIDSMYQNIADTIHTHNALNDQATINRLSSCFSLPNVFTRHYIFQMAVDTLIKHSDKGFDDSYFFQKYIENSNAIITKVYNQEDPFRPHKALSIWLDRYESFVKYLSHMLMPVYENLYFIKLWHSIRTTYPEKNEAECIVDLYKLLRQYLNNEACVQKLLSMEETFLKGEKNEENKDSKNNLIPSLFLHNDLNVSLYHQCALSQNITSKQEPIPDFLSLDYLNQYASNPTDKIQSFYIRSFTN